MFLCKIRFHDAFMAGFLINLDSVGSKLPSLCLLTTVSLLTITTLVLLGYAISPERDVMRALQLAAPGERLSVLCLGAHSDDIEIGAGATLLSMMDRGI